MFGDDLLPFLPEYIRPFAEQLKQFPVHYEKWVYATSFPPQLYQGDVFADVPFVAIGDDGGPIQATLRVMVLSNTCDAQVGQEDFVLIAPVNDLNEYRQASTLSGEDLANHIRDITQNRISNMMFLPSSAGIDDSFVDFGNVCSVSLTFFQTLIHSKRLVSLSQCGHYFFLIKLAFHFTRPEARDAVRVP